MQPLLSITKALGDESRIRALLALRDGELCLCQLIEVLGLSPSTVSKHMNLLQRAGLVDKRKQGKWHFYRMTDGVTNPTARAALDWVLAALRDDPRVRREAKTVRQVRRRDLEELSACYRI